MNDQASTVFVVDDDESVRRALARLIRSAGHRVEPFPSARAFLDAEVRATCPACLVLDVQMPGGRGELDGLDLQRELHAQRSRPDIPIIFITGHGDIQMSVRAMKAGAIDFLPKPVSDADLLRAIEQALARSVHDQVQRAELESLRQRSALLTPREHEVMALVVQGMLNKQVAHQLGTVEKTIKVHRARVMEKMQVDSLAALVRAVERLEPDTVH